MTARTVWLASYPKSGNTWVRAILTALQVHPHLFGVDHLGFGAQPYYVGTALSMLGLDSRWLTVPENEQLRDSLVRLTNDVGGSRIAPSEHRPLVRKTHEQYWHGSLGREPFPSDPTLAAILVVRDPRDVACSYAAFFGMSVDEAIRDIGDAGAGGIASPANCLTSQPWGSWSSHGWSWISEDVPFPVHMVRYEDLESDPLGTLSPVLRAIGVGVDDEDLASAIKAASFSNLQNSESTRGFRETSSRAAGFFRKGRSGAWREELSPDQVQAIESSHRELMQRLGYELADDSPGAHSIPAPIKALRHRSPAPWTDLPGHLGLSVSTGRQPEDLPGALRPRPWAQVTEERVLVRFPSGASLLVTAGTEIQVDLPKELLEGSRDPSWLVQGWGVTLAMLQRGRLSLHASGAQIGDEAVVLAGGRAAGKSTTAMGLRGRGHPLLVDDVAIVSVIDASAWITPYRRNVHLDETTAVALGVDFDDMPRLAGRGTKAAFLPEEPPIGAQLISRLVVLSPSPTDEAPSMRAVYGMDRFSIVEAHCRRDGIAPLVLGQEKYMDLVSRLASAQPIEILTRSTGMWSLETVLDLIESQNLRRPS